MLTSLRYYCEKYDLDYKKMINRYIRLSGLRMVKYAIARNSDQVAELRKIIDYAHHASK